MVAADADRPGVHVVVLPNCACRGLQLAAKGGLVGHGSQIRCRASARRDGGQWQFAEGP